MAISYAAYLIFFSSALFKNGAHSASVGQDAPSQCQPLRPPVNGLIQCSQSGTQLICTATCNNGYQFASGLKSERKSCDDTTGSWTNGAVLPFCIRLQQTKCNNSVLPSVKDSQITASSSWAGVKGYYFGPERARLGAVASHDGVRVNSGGWRPAFNTLDQYIQVQLNEVTRITGIITKGRNVVSGDTANEFVTKFRVLHSLDGKTWEPYSSVNVSDQFLDGNTDSDSPVTNMFSCPFDALYVRVNPLVWHENIALRFELLGCPPSSGPSKCSDLKTTITITERTTTIPTSSDLKTTITITERTTTIPTTTIQPRHLCHSVSPPTNGVVNCEESGDQLVCVANCKQGYRFVSNEVLVKRVCLQQSGAWPAGQGFPACVATTNPTPPPTHNSINQCLDVQKKCHQIQNGDYQACSACHFFATCSEGYLYVRACPEQLLFDAIKQQCDYHSRTCSGPNPSQPVG